MKYYYVSVILKRFLLWCSAVLYLIFGILPVSSAKGDTVGINFVGGSQTRGTPGPIRPSELAGFFVQKFWNNAYENNGTLSPVGDDEKGSSVSYASFVVTWTAFQTNTKAAEDFLEGSPDLRLGLGYLEATATQPAIVTLNNIPPEVTGTDGSYSLVVYFSLDNIDFKARTSGDKVNIFAVKGSKVGERTICGLQPSGAKPPLTGWAEVPETSSTDEGEKTAVGNYVVFSHLTDKDLILTATGGFASDQDSRAAINAIQIIRSK